MVTEVMFFVAERGPVQEVERHNLVEEATSHEAGSSHDPQAGPTSSPHQVQELGIGDGGIFPGETRLASTLGKVPR